MNIGVMKDKTTLTAIASVIVAGVGVALGDASAWQGLQAGVLSLVAIFMRSAIEKAATRAEDAAAQASTTKSEAPQMPASGDAG